MHTGEQANMMILLKNKAHKNHCAVPLLISGMSSSLAAETEKDVLPWLQLAEDLRLLKLDCEVSYHDALQQRYP
jgi:hypothetical protein